MYVEIDETRRFNKHKQCDKDHFYRICQPAVQDIIASLGLSDKLLECAQSYKNYPFLRNQITRKKTSKSWPKDTSAKFGFSYKL